MPEDAAPVGPDERAPDFPADTRSLVLGAAEFAAGGSPARRFSLSNAHHAVLHVRLAASAPWLRVAPAELALGPGETQPVAVRVAAEKARAAVESGASPVATVQLTFQRLFPGARGVAPSPPSTGVVYVRLPLATCPACGHALDEDVLAAGTPDLCPFCFERLRPCPICGAPNSWLARTCVLDPSHIVRAAVDWPMLGGGPEHDGCREERVRLALSRRWSFPSVPPASREAALAWSAPVAAYGLVAAAAATTQGEAHVYAFDAERGSPLWEPYPLPDPVYPERGGAAIASGRLFAATVEGTIACVDALRGTRVWQSTLPGRVYGAIVPADTERLLLVPVATNEGAGCLYVLEAGTGNVLHVIPLGGLPDAAPAFADGLAFVHDDAGTLTAIEAATGRVRWSASCGAGFDAAPTVQGSDVFSATSAGTVFCHRAATGEKLWQLAVTGAPLNGTPAHDGTLLYIPADDGLHLVSGGAGRAVRRYGLKRPVRSAPIVAGGALLFAGTDGALYGVDGGRLLQTLYETGAGSQIVAAPALSAGFVFVAATNGVLYALSAG